MILITGDETGGFGVVPSFSSGLHLGVGSRRQLGNTHRYLSSSACCAGTHLDGFGHTRALSYSSSWCAAGFEALQGDLPLAGILQSIALLLDRRLGFTQRVDLLWLANSEEVARDAECEGHDSRELNGTASGDTTLGLRKQRTYWVELRVTLGKAVGQAGDASGLEGEVSDVAFDSELP